MSWISENYEKAAVGGAAVVAIGLGFIGWQNLNAVEEDFSATPSGGGNEDAAVKGSDRVATAKSSFQLERDWPKGMIDGRPVDLFTGVPLFVNKNDPNNPVDLPKSADVHPPIPNQWWIDNRIDPGFGDSPERDEDEDGFSNLEEFIAKTDPTDNRSYPSLITKLSYVGDESTEWVLRPGFQAAEGAFTFEYNDTAGRRNRVGAAEPVKIGELFFAEAPIKERFKHLGSEVRTEMNEAIQAEVEVTIVSVEDQKPNKKGMVYEIPAQFRKADAREFSYFDRTAVLSLDALGMAGQEFKVEEFTEFSLPPDDASKRFKLTEVTPERIVVEETLEGGETQSFEILKGAVGPAAP